MSADKYQPHLLILPEDKAVREIVNGALIPPFIRQAANVATEHLLGGWRKVEQRMEGEYEGYLRRYPEARLLIVIDFDKEMDRRENVWRWIADDLTDRVFLLSCLDEPEDLRREVGLHFDEIGERMIRDCPTQRDEIWNHEHLLHNAQELDRFLASCGPILFG